MRRPGLVRALVELPGPCSVPSGLIHVRVESAAPPPSVPFRMVHPRAFGSAPGTGAGSCASRRFIRLRVEGTSLGPRPPPVPKAAGLSTCAWNCLAGCHGFRVGPALDSPSSGRLPGPRFRLSRGGGHQRAQRPEGRGFIPARAGRAHTAIFSPLHRRFISARAGRIGATWGRPTRAWGFKWTRTAFLGSIGHRKPACATGLSKQPSSTGCWRHLRFSSQKENTPSSMG